MGEFFAFLSDPAAYPALAALIAMEVVLGIDNLLFISILAQRLPPEQQDRARFIGISLALVLRLVFLGLVAFIVQLTTPLFTVFGQGSPGAISSSSPAASSWSGRRRRRSITPLIRSTGRRISSDAAQR